MGSTEGDMESKGGAVFFRCVLFVSQMYPNMLRNTLIAVSTVDSSVYSLGTNIRSESSENGYNRVTNAIPFDMFLFVRDCNEGYKFWNVLYLICKINCGG
jgi:hypothetical protein